MEIQFCTFHSSQQFGPHCKEIQRLIRLSAAIYRWVPMLLPRSDSARRNTSASQSMTPWVHTRFHSYLSCLDFAQQQFSVAVVEFEIVKFPVVWTLTQADMPVRFFQSRWYRSHHRTPDQKRNQTGMQSIHAPEIVWSTFSVGDIARVLLNYIYEGFLAIAEPMLDELSRESLERSGFLVR